MADCKAEAALEVELPEESLVKGLSEADFLEAGEEVRTEAVVVAKTAEEWTGVGFLEVVKGAQLEVATAVEL